jgi:quercetin dioxygenase-like cupin family protein
MKITLFALALVASAVIAGPSGAAARQPIVAKALAAGTMNATLVHATTGAMVLDQITIAPGGNFGWHTHGSPVAVVVTSGTLTVFDPAVGKCAPFKVSKGQSFVEPANHIHLARNDTTKSVTLYAMYLGIPKNAGANVPAKQPAGCAA